MKSEHFLKEGFVEDASDVHADHEVQMARSDLFHAAEDALVLHKLLRNVSEQQGLEGWVAAKITLASDYLKTVREYIEYELMTAASEQPMLPIAEGSGSKEKQKTPYRDINSPEYRKAAEKQKEKMDKEKAAEPGKKLLGKIEKQEVEEAANDYFKRRKDEEDRIAGTKAPAKRTPQQTDYAKRRAQEKTSNESVAEGSKELPQWKKDWYAKQKSNSWPKHPQPYHNPNWIDELSPEERKKLKREKGVAEGLDGQVVFSGTGANGVKYEIIQSGDDFMIHANGRHIDSYGSLQRAMSVLKNEVPGLTKGVAEGSSCNMTMEGKSCPMHGLKECPGYKSNIEETTAGSVATVVNPTPKNKSKVGTLFGGTYKQKKSK
jgi:hypothetical protein